jgi:putative ABC transport system permease protein
VSHIEVLPTLVDELRRALRLLAVRPAASLAAIVVLGAGFGISIPLLSYLDYLAVRDSPFPDAGNLVSIQTSDVVTGGVQPLEAGQAEVIKSVTGLFAGVGEYALAGELSPDLVPALQSVPGCFVDSGTLRLLGVAPLIGRQFADAEGAGGDGVALISYSLWQRAYRNNPEVLGQVLLMGWARYRIIGVMPRGFRFPAPAQDVWIPLPARARAKGMMNVQLVARLKRGVDARNAQELAASVLRKESGDANARLTLTPVDDIVSIEARTAAPLLALGILAALVLSAAVVWHILLTEVLRSRSEVGVRLALGSPWWRALCVFPLKGLLIALAGFAVGLLLARHLNRLNWLYVLNASPVADGARTEVLLASGLLCGAVGTVAGLAAAFAYRGSSIPELIGATPNRLVSRAGAMRRILVSAQVCCATAFVVFSGLLFSSMQALAAVSPGFPTRGLLTVMVGNPHLLFPPPEQRHRVLDYWERLLERAKRLPGVTAVAAASTTPVYSAVYRGTFDSGGLPRGCRSVLFRAVSLDYFSTVGLTLREGRLFTPADGRSGEPVAVANEALARVCWPGRSAVGQFFGPGAPAMRFIGVVGDVRTLGLRKGVEPELYIPLASGATAAMCVILRVDSDNPYRPLDAFRRLVASTDPETRTWEARSVDDIISQAAAPLTVRGMLLGEAALCTVLVAVVGVYATTAAVARQRRRERAIRLALGAEPLALQIRGMLELLSWSVPGLAIGCVGALWGASSLVHVLYGTSPAEPWVYSVSVGGVALLVVVSAMVGGRDVHRADLPTLLRCE